MGKVQDPELVFEIKIFSATKIKVVEIFWNFDFLGSEKHVRIFRWQSGCAHGEVDTTGTRVELLEYSAQCFFTLRSVHFSKWTFWNLRMSPLFFFENVLGNFQNFP